MNRITLYDSNVREIVVEAGLQELTHDIDPREDLVQGLNLRAILEEGGNETGDFESPAGRCRYRSIARLVETVASRLMAWFPTSSRRPTRKAQPSMTRSRRIPPNSTLLRSTKARRSSTWPMVA
ncbi:hypothetical protein [Rhizobium lusitanum]|uniref:hypothetical protein n=1 Tax=Rhizobium lusitanum TaxID=293958 RepID=UPI001573DCB4|nr:hypothetical protein [Rhizobium lusitanum]